MSNADEIIRAQEWAGGALVRDNERLRHDLAWQYDEVALLRSAMRQALNALLRPASLEWPGDESPLMEASRILSEALSPARRHSADGRLTLLEKEGE